MKNIQQQSFKALRVLTFFVLFPVIILMNACGLLVSENTDAANSGRLTAVVVLYNPGAMSDYSGTVWVLPRYFPSVWPLDVMIGCRALDFGSDPRVDVEWKDSALLIHHDPFLRSAVKRHRCYGRDIILKERKSA